MDVKGYNELKNISEGIKKTNEILEKGFKEIFKALKEMQTDVGLIQASV